MTDDLTAEYPEVAPYIWDAVEEHGEDWVAENYYQHFGPMGVVMDIPDVEELPFYDEDEHDPLTKAERREYFRGLRGHRKNLRQAAETRDEESDTDSSS